MRKTQIAASSLAALWQGLVLDGVLLLVVVLAFGVAGEPFRIFCVAMAAQLVTAGCILARRPAETTRGDRLAIRFGIVPLWAIAYLAAPWIARLLNGIGGYFVG